MVGRLRLVYGGWLAFLLSGVCFVISGIRAGDSWTVAGSVVWILGVVLFVVATGRSDRL